MMYRAEVRASSVENMSQGEDQIETVAYQVAYRKRFEGDGTSFAALKRAALSVDNYSRILDFQTDVDGPYLIYQTSMALTYHVPSVISNGSVDNAP